MKSNAALRSAAGFSGLMILGWVLTGQAAKPAKQGIPLPTDWSHRHLIFSRPGSAEQLARVSKDPRYQQQLHRQGESLNCRQTKPISERLLFPAEIRGKKHKIGNGFWAEDLGSGASVGAGNYPAKFSVNSTTANCGGGPAQPDFVVYSTGVAGSSGQASIVAFDNLYSGCGGGTPPVPVPSVYWAYNTLGTVLTSPLISLDGTQVAFVETNGSSAFLVVLKWATSDGTVFSPRTLTVTPAATYSGCGAPCMTELALGADDTASSVFYDYTNDIGWVGDASGLLHKIIGVFKGTPTEITTGGFPVQVSTTTLSSPVYDSLSQNVFVGDLGWFSVPGERYYGRRHSVRRVGLWRWNRGRPDRGLVRRIRVCVCIERRNCKLQWRHQRLLSGLPAYSCVFIRGSWDRGYCGVKRRFGRNTQSHVLGCF